MTSPITSGSEAGLLALAERCEAASGPDRELDSAIMRAVVPAQRARSLGHADAICDFPWPDTAPRYTASLDAAMTLTPDGWYLRVEPRFYSEDGQVRWRAHAIKPDWPKWSPHDDWFETIENVDANKSALALCAAALRARASQEQQP